MSIDLVDSIHLRLREELERLGYKLAAAARAAGETSSQRLKDVVTGRQKCPADLLARLAVTRIDLAYVLTGERGGSARDLELPADEQLLLDSYRGLSAARRKQLLASLLAGDVAKKSTKAGGVVVSGSGNRAAGRDYHE